MQDSVHATFFDEERVVLSRHYNPLRRAVNIWTKPFITRAVLAVVAIVAIGLVVGVVFGNTTLAAIAVVGGLIGLGTSVTLNVRKQHALEADRIATLERPADTSSDVVADSSSKEYDTDYKIKISMLEGAGGEYAKTLTELQDERRELFVEIADTKNDNDPHNPASLDAMRKRGAMADRVTQIDTKITDLHIQLLEQLKYEHGRAVALLESLRSYRERITQLKLKQVNVDALSAFFDPLFNEVAALAEGDNGNLQLLKKLPSCVQRMTRVDQAVSEIENEAQLLESGPANLKANITNSRAKLATLSAAIERCRQEYGPDAIAQIEGSDTTAEQHLIVAEQELAKLTHPLDLTRPREQWAPDLAAIKNGTSAATKAAELIDTIGEFEQSLARAKAGSGEALATAANTVSEAQAFISGRSDDLTDDTAVTDLKSATSLLEQATTASRVSQPNYLMVVSLANQAKDAAIRALQAADNQSKSAARTRQDLARTVNACKAKLSQYEGVIRQAPERTYSQGLKRDVKAARTLLDNLESVPYHLRLSKTEALLSQLHQLGVTMDQEYEQSLAKQ